MNKTTTPIEKIGDQYTDCYVVYTRKSTDDADNQKNSIEYQVGASVEYKTRHSLPLASLSLDGFCEDGIVKEHHSGFKEDDFFQTNTDGTISFKVERPKFLMLVNLLLAKKIKGVICLCWDRLSRNEADDVLIKKLISQGADIRFVQTTYDTTSSGALHMDIDGMFSRHYSRSISEKVRNTNKKLRNEGKCIYTPPLGYISAGSASKPLDPERAPLIKRIFELYATGEWSFSTLAAWANRNGLTTKPCRRNRTLQEKLQGLQLADMPKVSKPVTEKTIWHILNNPFYIGKLTHKGELLNSKAHQPLIDLATFYKVQAMLKQKAVKVYYPNMAFFTYRGLVKCGTCGRTYSPYTQKEINYYRSPCKKGCTNPLKNINDTFITKKVQEILERIHFTDDEIQRIEANAGKAMNKLTDQRNKHMEDLRFQKNKTLENLKYLTDDKLNLLRTGVFTPMQIIEEEGRLNALLKDIEEKMAAFSEPVKTMLDCIISFSELVKHASFYFGHALDAQKRNIVIQVFSELYINKGQLKYQATEAYNALLMRYDASILATCGEDYIVLELDKIYTLAKNNKPKMETIINAGINNKKIKKT